MVKLTWLLAGALLAATSSVQAGGGPGHDLLPDLVTLPTRSVGFETGAYASDLTVPSLPRGCYPDERLRRQARRCLRFDLIVANEGDGPFELRFRLDGIADPDTRDVVQRIFASDGSHRDRIADTYTFHATHAHFHYRGFAQAHLWTSSAAGQRLEAAPARSSRKIGFCMIDVERLYGAERPAYRSDRCRVPKAFDAGTEEVSLVNGISVGWADVYHWYLGDQYIDVSGVADGFYLLETIVDPEDTVVEGDNTNNATQVLIRIAHGSAEIVDRPRALIRPDTSPASN